MTPAEAVLLLRKFALSLKASQQEGEAIAVLIDHVGTLERTVEQAMASHESAFRYVPDYAVHLVGKPTMKSSKTRNK